MLIITVSGPAGSGKTTLARILSERIGCSLIATGALFREMAAEKGLDVLQFNLLAEKDDGIDKELDRKVVDAAVKNGDCIVEGRLSCHMLIRAGIKPFSVYLEAPAEVRVERVAGREGRDVALAVKETVGREESERRRYMKVYGIDINDKSCYELVLDSSSSDPETLADAVMSRLSGGFAHE